MKLTIIVPDGTVGIDGEFRRVSLAGINPHVRVVQWDGVNGHVEFNNGSPNLGIDSIDMFSVFVDRWNALTPPPPQPPTLAEIKAHAWDSIKALRDKYIQSGGYQVAGKWFHSDTFSRTQQIGLVMLGAGIPAGLQWKTMDGSFVLMTQTLAQQVFAAAAIQDTAIFSNAEFHRAAINAMTNGEAIASYDITTGWPAVFA